MAKRLKHKTPDIENHFLECRDSLNVSVTTPIICSLAEYVGLNILSCIYKMVKRIRLPHPYLRYAEHQS